MKFALKIKNNDYYPIPAGYLDIMINDYNFANLDNIDKFTANFSEFEIKESIKRANFIDLDKIDISTLVIIYIDNQNIRELPVYTKDNSDYLEFNPIEFLIQIIQNKNLTNQICNYFNDKNYIPEDLQDFSKDIKDGIVDYTKYDELSPMSKRLLKTYLYDQIVPKIGEQQLKKKI